MYTYTYPKWNLSLPSLASCQDATCAKESDIDSNLLQLLFEAPTRRGLYLCKGQQYEVPEQIYVNIENGLELEIQGLLS